MKDNKMTADEYNALGRQINELITKFDNATIVKPNPFDISKDECAYYIHLSSNKNFNVYETNLYVPCIDRDIVSNVVKEARLKLKLMRFAIENDSLVTEDMWEDETIPKYYITKDCINNYYLVHSTQIYKDLNSIYFTSKKICDKAIEEIMRPLEKF